MQVSEQQTRGNGVAVVEALLGLWEKSGDKEYES